MFAAPLGCHSPADALLPMRTRFPRACLVFLTCLVCVHPATASERWWSWLSPRLLEIERKQREAQREEEALGSPMIGQTAPELGFRTTRRPTHGRHWVQVDLRTAQAIDRIALIPAQIE